uniref:Exportin-5 n=1 Tax=Ditylenchus dipsaci TaxID=166011 RepID=A0A915EI34_9BILA
MPVLNNNNDDNVNEVVQAVRAIHDIRTSNERRLFFTQAIETLKEANPANAVALAFKLVLHDGEKTVRHVGWNIIEHIIRYKWLDIDIALRIKIRNGVLEQISSGEYALGSSDSHIKTAMSRSVVYMMENEWPQNWPELFPQFQQVVGDTKLFPQCQMVFVILKRLIEDVVTLATVEEANRRKELSTAITNHMKDILNMTIARIRVCLAGGINENSVLLAKSAIELLSEITDSFGIYETAAKCLWKLASRKCSKTQETPIVVSMFRDSAIKSILSAASLAAEVSASSADHYKYLKALCDLLCALGVHLSDVWSYIMNPPPNFHIYLSAISAFFTHPSIYIRAETSQVLAAFSAHERISKHADYINCITSLFQYLPRCMERVGISSMASANNLTLHYSQMDYEDDDEQLRDFLVLREKCCRIIRESTSDHFDPLLAIVNDWLSNRFMTQPESVRPDEWDMMKRFITTFLTAAYQFEKATPEVREIFLSLFDAILARISSMTDAKTANGALSILSSFFQTLDDYPDRVPLVLAQLKTMLMLKNANNDDTDILSLKRHCIVLLLKMITSYSNAIKPYAQSVLDAVVQVADHVSVMQRANLVHILGALSNLAGSTEQQQTFLRNATQNNLQYFLSEQFTTCIQSPQNLFAYIGLTSRAPLTEIEASTNQFYENRLKLKSHLTAIDGVLTYVEVPKDQSNPVFSLLQPIIPSLFQLARCVNSIYSPQSAAHIHSSYGRKVLDITSNERQIVFFSMLDASDQKESDGSPTNGSDHQPTHFLRRFLVELTEIAQSLIGLVGAKFHWDFYDLPDLSNMMLSTLLSIESVPDIRLRFWIKRTWLRLVCSCPMDKSSVVVSLTINLMTHFQQLLTDRWATVQNRNDEAEPSEEELFVESVTSVLSREYSTFLKAIVMGEFSTHKGSKKDVSDLLDPLGRILLNNKEILQNTIASLAKLINCPDTHAASKCIPVLSAVVGNFYTDFDEQMSTFTLVHSIRSLQVHGSDETILGPMLSLSFTVYSLLRPVYPSLLEILKQVPDSVADNVLNFDNKVMSMLQNGAGGKEGKPWVDKSKRDLMRKVLKPVIGLNLGEQHKRPVHLRRLV